MIGAGDVTEVKSGPALYKTPHSELVAVMRRNGAKAADYAKRHGVPRWYDDAEALLHDPDVNAIYVATPPNTHAEYAIRAMEAGKPVYVEKPMAMNYAECRRMVEVSEATGQPLFVAYYRRRLPTFLKVKELLEAGAIGDLRFVNLSLYQAPKPHDVDGSGAWRTNPAVAGGGYFFDLGSHQLDLLDYFLGEIREVHSVVANQGAYYTSEDVLSASFRFASGVVGSATWCFTTGQAAETDRTELVGSLGRITYETFKPSPVVLETSVGIEKLPFEYPPHVHQPLVETVVQALRGEGTCPSTGISAARTSRVMDELVQPYYARTARS
ncbi:Predicted dehydrogenase [Catalinimonas alkaloidigena]|uniref:Predicted dehydrogenase n=2 Tax=Catalinimonas alkaloidigena TaxID=1075417 RepID=A0A1G9REV8_9BACT|nr:Predicted dehydrogenase [Catalinimonas alkaloidigena]